MKIYTQQLKAFTFSPSHLLPAVLLCFITEDPLYQQSSSFLLDFY